MIAEMLMKDYFIFLNSVVTMWGTHIICDDIAKKKRKMNDLTLHRFIELSQYYDSEFYDKIEWQCYGFDDLISMFWFHHNMLLRNKNMKSGDYIRKIVTKQNDIWDNFKIYAPFVNDETKIPENNKLKLIECRYPHFTLTFIVIFLFFYFFVFLFFYFLFLFFCFFLVFVFGNDLIIRIQKQKKQKNKKKKNQINKNQPTNM